MSFEVVCLFIFILGAHSAPTSTPTDSSIDNVETTQPPLEHIDMEFNQTIVEPETECFCTKEKIPVCDISGQEFDNECLLICQSGFSAINRIACRSRCPCVSFANAIQIMSTPKPTPLPITTLFPHQFHFSED